MKEIINNRKLHNEKKQKQQPRQAISGMIVTIILIGIVVSIGGVLSVTLTDVVSTGLVLDTMEVQRINIQNTQDKSYLIAQVKNNGNSDFERLRITIIDEITNVYAGTVLSSNGGVYDGGAAQTTVLTGTDTTDKKIQEYFAASLKVKHTGSNGVSYYPFSPSSIKPGQSTTVNVGLDTDGAATTGDVRLDIGKKYLVEIKANVVGGGEIAKTITVTPR